MTEFKPGDHVITLLSPDTVEKGGDEAFPDFPAISDGLGQRRNGTLQTHGVFPQSALVHGPKSIGWIEASTLTCSGLTAWNSLFGFQGKQVSAGDWVLTQGTGGVSVAALQLAVAAGATVVATTSSDAKAERLRALGATHVVNYHANPEGWGEQAKALTPNGAGFDFIVDIGGDATLGQCVPAAKTDGIVVLAGLRGSGEPVPLLAALIHPCVVRGVLAGTRRQLRDLVRFVDENGVVPAVDDVEFELKDVKEAYRRLAETRHFSKVAIKINH